jgi:hypothetical protein
MARGKYWEITYDPDHDDPTETVNLANLEGVTGWDNRMIVGEGANPVAVRFRVSDPARHFERCNFTARVVDSNIANWHFNRCTFKGSKWENVNRRIPVFALQILSQSAIRSLVRYYGIGESPRSFCPRYFLNQTCCVRTLLSKTAPPVDGPRVTTPG